MAETLPPLLLVGCGRMGGALLDGWEAMSLAPSVIVDPALDRLPGAGPHRLLRTVETVPEAFRPAAIVLAVKPQGAAAVLPALAPLVARSGAVVLSIMAGRRIEGLVTALGGDRPAAVVRAMPNTPAAIGQGMTVACAGPGVSDAGRALCDRLLQAAGEVAWIEDEPMLDAVTAVSGSGPAYLFLLAEALETAAREQGLPPALARLLVRQTLAGSGALLAASAEDAAHLRQAVTSPGGTTERALAVLMREEEWSRLLREAVAAATERSRALAC